MVNDKSSIKEYLFPRFKRKKLFWGITFGSLCLTVLFAFTETRLPEILQLKTVIVKKYKVSGSRVTDHEIKPLTPVDRRCSSRGSRLVPVKRGRLGNWMFQYASASSIARRLGMDFVLSDYSELLSIFKLKPGIVGDIRMQGYSKIRERVECAYDPNMLDLPCDQEVHLCCYLQSWKYFNAFESDLRSEFVFNLRIENLINFYWNTAILPATKTNYVVTFVAVHVRRGDKNDPNNLDEGTTVATEEYLLRGYEYFRNKFGGSDTLGNDTRNMKVLFVVCSDDLPWTRQFLPHESSVFVDSGAPEVDMAVLSRCNHTLMTVGTFGWWVSWLVDGVTVYYKHIFTPGSALAKTYNNSLVDWVLPHWIPME